MADSEDPQLRILKVILDGEVDKKWDAKGLVFAHAAKWKRSTISDVMILQELEVMREENKTMKDQMGEMRREQSELTDLVRKMSGVILGNNQDASEPGKANKGGTNKPQEKSARDWSGDKNTKKPRNEENPLPGSREYAEAKNGPGAEEKKVKRVRTVMNEDGTDVVKEPYTIPKSRYRPQKIPEAQRIKLKEKNEEETAREVIFCGIPSPPKYVKDSPYETAKLVMEACDELKTKYLGNYYGINVKPTDLAFAQRQIGHINKKFTPITARFRKKDVAEKVLAAAKFLNILNKRGTAQFGKYREPVEQRNDKDEVIKPNEDVVERFNNRPKTFLKASRTLEQQQSDRAARDHRESKAYKDRQDVKEFKKEQRISQAHFEAAAADMPADDDSDGEHDEEQYGKIPEPPGDESFKSVPETTETTEQKQKREDKEAAESQKKNSG